MVERRSMQSNHQSREKQGTDGLVLRRSRFQKGAAEDILQ